MSFGITSLVLTERKYLELQEKLRNGETIKESEKEILQLFKELNYSKCPEINIINFFDLLREVIAEENVKK